MKAWLRSARGMRRLSAAALLVALAVAVNRGLALPEEFPECGGRQSPGPSAIPSPGEPPMVDGPMPPQTPASPRPPFTPPFPTPLPPEQAGPPFVPGMPFVPAEPKELPEPVVRLRVLAPARIEADKEIEYRLTVENVSRADAHHVLVRDRLPHGMEKGFRAEPKPSGETKTKDDLTDLLWELGTLKAGENKVIVLTIKPKGTDDVRNRAYVQFEHGQTVVTQIAKPGLRLKVTAPAQAILYESIPFRIEIHNSGSATLRDVVLTEELPDGLKFVTGKPEPSGEKPWTWKIGDVPPGETRRIEYQAVSTTKTGKFSDKAKVTATGGISATDSAAVTVGEAKLKISTSGPARRSAHRPIPYHITVRNLGSVPLTNVQVSDEIPRAPRGPGFELQHASAGGRLERGFVRWSLGTVLPGERRSLLVVLRAPAPGWCWNAVTLRADNNISEKATSEATRIDAAVDPILEIDKTMDSLDAGQKMSYTIHLFNPMEKSVLNSRLIVTVPDEMIVIGERGATTGQREGQTVRFAPLEVLSKGEHKEYTVEVQAKKAGAAKLRASWTEGVSPMKTWEDSTIILDSTAPSPAKELSGKKLQG